MNGIQAKAGNRDYSAWVKKKPARIAAELLEQCLNFDSATLHEAAGKIGDLPPEIKPVDASFRVCGPAVTVHSPPGDNLWLHRAIYEAEPGDVLVVYVEERFDHGYWGEIMAEAALARKLGGLVIDGCVRDVPLLRSIGFPVFARGACIRGTGKDFDARGWINSPIRIGRQTIHAGDLVFGDEDGVVVLPAAQVDAVLNAAQVRQQDELALVEALRNGQRTLDWYGWA